MANHILVPVDDVEHSERVIEYVINTMNTPSITLLHVLDPVSSVAFTDAEEFDMEAYQRIIEQQRESAEDMLAALETDLEAAGYDVNSVIKSGPAARRILEWVDENEVDHIVMASEGRTGVGRILLGSVAEMVTRRAPVPVTIVR